MDVSFSYFISQVFSNPILAMTVALTLGVIFVNGWTDAPNAIATCVTTRCLPPKAAIIMSAVFNFLGVFIMTHINASVASTISNMVDFGSNTQIALIALCAALFSIVVYSVGASIFGIPTSESHSLIAGLTGAAIALGGADGVNMNEWVKVLYGLVLSLGLGFAAGWVVCKVVTLLFANTDRRKSNTFFRWAQIAGAAGMSFMHGAKDGQKFIGVLFLGVAFCNGQPSVRHGRPRLAHVAVLDRHGRRHLRGQEREIDPWAWTWLSSRNTGASAGPLKLAVPAASHPHQHPRFTTHVKTTAIMGVARSSASRPSTLALSKIILLTWVFFPAAASSASSWQKLFLLFI